MIDFNVLDEVYTIAEIGINHNGDMQIAKRLIDASFSCGWSAVKFQKRDPDVSVPDHQKDVLRQTPWGEMTYLDYKKKIEFGSEEYAYIDTYCREKPIDWTVSIWDLPSLDFIMRFSVSFLKIPSAHITNLELVEAMSRSGVPLIASTGMSTVEEVDACVEVMAAHSSNFALLHCNSTYPALDNELNLRVITTLQERYGCPVGYSGHEYGVEPSVLAVVIGAMIIERHVTIDHNLWGTDQASSLEIEGMDKLLRRIRSVKSIMGSAEKVVGDSEMEVRKKLRGN